MKLPIVDFETAKELKEFGAAIKYFKNGTTKS